MQVLRAEPGGLGQPERLAQGQRGGVQVAQPPAQAHNLQRLALEIRAARLPGQGNRLSRLVLGTGPRARRAIAERYLGAQQDSLGRGRANPVAFRQLPQARGRIVPPAGGECRAGP